MLDERIAAVITPPGEGAIGAVRISGTGCWDAVARILRTPQMKQPQPTNRRMRFGYLVHPETEAVIDEVMYVWMRGPRSYTGEDIIEIFCHGGPTVVRQVLQAVFSTGIRPAEAGEFSRRALLNGRMDLAQVEAVIDLIRAKTELAAKVAVQQLRGRLSQAISRIEERILLETAALEAVIDFPEDDAAFIDVAALGQHLQELLKEIEEMLENARSGQLIREGARLAIVGSPNVGKSSLLNALSCEERAIVTEIPGTTRDVLEEWVNVRGIPVCLADTAGIRDTEDVVEKIGVSRARQYLDRADMVLFIIDAGSGIGSKDMDIYRLIGEKPAVIILNKADLPAVITPEDAGTLFPGRPVVPTSLTENRGLDVLEDVIASQLMQGSRLHTDGIVVASERHIHALREAADALTGAAENIRSGLESDLMVADLRAALSALGRITGRNVTESLLDTIFSQFCVGK